MGKKNHTMAKMSKQVSLVWTGSQSGAQTPFSNKMFSLTSSNLLDGWCSDVLRFPKRMEVCGSEPPSVCSEKVPSASLPWSVICNTSQNTQTTLLWPWPTSSMQTQALHIWAAPSCEGSPIPPLPYLPLLKGLSPSITALPHHRYPRNAAALATGWALAPAAQIPISMQTGTQPVPYFNMPKLCFVFPTSCIFALHLCCTILSYNSGLWCASQVTASLTVSSPNWPASWQRCFCYNKWQRK